MDTSLESERSLSAVPVHLFAAAASIGAGIVHLGLIAAHIDDYPEMAAGFGVVGWLQVLAGAWILLRPSVLAAWSVAMIHIGAIGSWWVYRIGAMPEFFTRRSNPHGAGWGEMTALGFEVGAILLAVLVAVAVRVVRVDLRGKVHGSYQAVATLVVIAVASAGIGIGSSSHNHSGGGHGHDHGTVGAERTQGRYAVPRTSGHSSRTTLNGTRDVVARFWDNPDWANGGVSGMGLDRHLPCTTPPTDQERAYADRFWREVWEANERYRDFRVAIAEGFTPGSPYDRPVVHYTRIDRLQDGRLLDPHAPESLVYVFPLDGSPPVLVGVMFIGEGWEGYVESPGGCLIQWHIHYDLCMGTMRVAPAYAGPNGECPPGTVNQPSTPMVHVWMIDMPTGPYQHAGLPELDAALGGALLRPPKGDRPEVVFAW